jgi:hypothetical protein
VILFIQSATGFKTAGVSTYLKSGIGVVISVDDFLAVAASATLPLVEIGVGPWHAERLALQAIDTAVVA